MILINNLAIFILYKCFYFKQNLIWNKVNNKIINQN